MKFIFTIFSLVIICLAGQKGQAQRVERIDPDLLTKAWDASWINYAHGPDNNNGVYLFRKTFEIGTIPKEFIIHISGDNRYRLFVNGHFVVNGPARGDELNWRFESVDVHSKLIEGENVISAIVWNFGKLRPVAQHSVRTGLIVQGNSELESIINTNESWKVFRDESYRPIPFGHDDVLGYFAVGPGENFDGHHHPWGWKEVEFDDTYWEKPRMLSSGIPKTGMFRYGGISGPLLVPREIPFMEEKLQQFGRIRSKGLTDEARNILSAEGDYTVPANSEISILLDQDHLTTAYPTLKTSGGQNSRITLTYAESLRNEDNSKGNRNEVDGKKMVGYHDTFISDGGKNRAFQTLWWRTFRYVEVKIYTASDPLTIHEITSIFTAYPLKQKASFFSNDSTLAKIWDVGWRTQRLCAGETFFDCPYYEQLQYIGDTRIQAFITYYVTGDIRLFKKAITDFNDSRLPFGLTQSRYPSYFHQIIPPYSLFWIAMVHDYWMLVDDPDLIKDMLPGISGVLNWYQNRLDANGMLGPMEWWNFVDWVNFEGWQSGIPRGAEDGNSAIISLQLVYNLYLAADLFQVNDMPDVAASYRKMADEIKSSTYSNCWDASRKLLADTPEKENFSQHANVMAVLVDAIPGESQKDLMNRIIDDHQIAQVSYYYTFYLIRALEKTGLSENYRATLTPWETMLSLGLTTFAEEPEPTRSDCHAWSASPLYEFLALIAGIKPGSPGFKTVRIEPSLGVLENISVIMPHYMGDIKVDLEKVNGGKLKGEINMPENLSGTFVQGSIKMVLKGGKNVIDY